MILFPRMATTNSMQIHHIFTKKKRGSFVPNIISLIL